MYAVDSNLKVTISIQLFESVAIASYNLISIDQTLS